MPVSVGIPEYDRVTLTECTQKVASAANLMRDLVSPRLAQFGRIEGEDRLFDEIQCDAGDIAGLFAIEGLAQRMDYQLISIWI